MKKYFGYIRVSTAKQGEQGVSLQEQREAIDSYVKRNSLLITDWFEERETAAKKGRPIFTRMMKLIRSGKADGIIIHKIDRGARNLKDWADIGELIDKEVEVHFANENLDLNSRGGRLSADIQAVVAADYIRNLREESRKGFYGRLKQGLYPLPAPLGYLDKGQGKPKEPDPAKAPLVKRAFELYATSKYTLNTLTEKMYCLGLRNRNGKKVSKNSFSIMLRNPYYIGLIRIKSTGEVFTGAHEPIIRKKIFDRVQLIMDGKINAKIQKHNFLFRRLFTCKYCGYSLIGERQKGHIYYRCHTKDCPTTCIKESEIDNEMYRTLSKVKMSKQHEAYFKHKIADLAEKWETKKEDQIAAIKLNLNRLQERLDRLTDAYIDRLIEKDVYEDRKKSMLLERKSFEEKISELEASTKPVSNKLSRFLELAKDPYLSYKLGLPEHKIDVLKKTTSNLKVEGKNAQIELKLPYQEVATCYKDLIGGPHRARPRKKLDILFKKLVEYFSSDSVDG